jgi:glycerol-3-phosphate dehydrogenase
MATCIDDVLARRTRLRLQARDATIDAAPVVADLLAAELGWDDEHTAAEVAAYVRSVEHERSSAELPVTALPGVVA